MDQNNPMRFLKTLKNIAINQNSTNRPHKRDSPLIADETLAGRVIYEN